MENPAPAAGRLAEERAGSTRQEEADRGPCEGEAAGSQENPGPAASRPAAISPSASSSDPVWSQGGSGQPAEKLLRKLRWATLGPNFDWSLRAYDPAVEHRPLPEDLRRLSTQVVAAVREAWDARFGPGASQLPGEAAGFDPDVAIVNYYRCGVQRHKQTMDVAGLDKQIRIHCIMPTQIG